MTWLPTKEQLEAALGHADEFRRVNHEATWDATEESMVHLAAEVRRLRGVIDTVASMADDCAEELKAALRV